MGDFAVAGPVDSFEVATVRTVTAGDFPVAVANVEGCLLAVQHLCPHQGARFGNRRLVDGHVLVCPRHGSRYGVRTGACVEPAPDGFDSGLRTFETQVVDGTVHVRV